MNIPPVEVNLDKPTAYKAGQTALDKTREGGSELVHESKRHYESPRST